MDRPALKRILKDIEAGLVDVVVVYKIDRLTRSLADFAKLVEVFDAKKVSFVAVTQQFNTTTSMGRLTLNVLLSFAQFERELASERVKDKVAASRKKGKWTGGSIPLGYNAIAKKLVINPAEAETVRMMFERYLGLRSFQALIDELNAKGIGSKKRAVKGKQTGGVPFTSPMCSRTASTLAKQVTAASGLPASINRSSMPKPSRPCRTSSRKTPPGALASAIAAARPHRPRLRRPRQPHEPELHGQERRPLSVLCEHRIAEGTQGSGRISATRH